MDIREISDIAAAGEKESDLPGVSVSEEFDLEKYQLFQGDVQSTFSDGEIFNLGERTVQVVHTPGHSPGHHSFSISTDLADRIEKVHAEN